ncbi:MAG TPA: hypothetical protein VES66_00535 [Terriglobales bacterium]|nr:hypothetical protein [Terriglobales bacterium]
MRAAWRNKAVVSLFFACNLLLAAAVAAPMHSAIADHLGHSMMANELARGFSAPWLTEFQLAYAHFLKGFSIAIVYGGILFLLLNAVLSAGAFEVFARAEQAKPEGGGPAPGSLRWSMHAFGRGIGRFWGRFLRLTAIASVFYYVLFWFWASRAAQFDRWLFRHSVREAPHFYLEWLRWGLLFFCCFVVNAIVDYTRVALVAHPDRSTLAAIGDGAGFVVGRLGRVMAIYLGLGLLSALAVLAYAAFARFFPQSSVITVFIWFVVAQILLWMRWFLRLGSWGAAVAYYESRSA